MQREFIGQIIAVTGAASGIGREVVRKFAEEGAAVIALDVNEEGVKTVAKSLVQEGYDVSAMCMDINDETDVDYCFNAIKEKYGSLNILVNCAGIITFEKFDQHNGTCWDKVMNVNLRGTYLCCRRASIIMREQRSGAIVNISAGAAKTGGMNPSPAYIASKGGINSLTFHFAVQLAPFGVRVNAICPGPIDTPMIDAQASLPGKSGDGKKSIIASVPLGLGYPSDVAYGVLFLASNVRARYITGEILDINGGLVMD
jgi:3-oxoacyl-[acyl-carrier protein] reductase